MDEYATRKSFWRRNGMKLPGSVRIVPSHTQQTANRRDDDSTTQTPSSLDARFTYTTLVTKRHTIPPTEDSALPPALPLFPITTDKPSPSSTTATTTTTTYHSSNNPEVTLSNLLTSSSSSSSSTLTQTQSSRKNDHAQHKRHTSSTQHKSFNAFLEDTNDEWDNLIEEKNKDRQGKSIPGTSSTATDFTTPSSPRQTSMMMLPLPSSTSIYTTSLVSEPQQNLIISKLTLADEQLPQSSSQPPAIPSTQLYKKSTDVNGVIDNVKDVLKDPTLILNDIEPEKTSDPSRTKKMKEVLCNANVDLVALRRICWSGIPPDFRLIAWQLLLGYLPCNSERRMETLARKRKEYMDSVKATYARGTEGLDQALWHQIHIDILRTNPGVILYQSTITQACLERILYQWAIRHPASGYVQGINDLVMPIFEVFLSAYIDTDPEEYDMNKLNQDILNVVEADSFWCLSKLLDGIQDNYTFAQPGIQRQIVTLKDLVSRIDARLVHHLQQEGIEFIQFAFRWMNCLLMRELPLKITIRMWDTYLAEGSSEGFSEFHVYVCAAFLVKWSAQLQKMDFQEVMIFLQQLPTDDWQEKDIELLLSEAYMWKTLFSNSPSHLKNK